MTTEEWVRQLNQLAAKIDDRCLELATSLHPSGWYLDPDLANLNAAWKAVVKEVAVDSLRVGDVVMIQTGAYRGCTGQILRERDGKWLVRVCGDDDQPFQDGDGVTISVTLEKIDVKA